MKLNYYPETDSLYIDLSERPSVESRELSEGLVLDYDANGNLVGIDIDNASTKVDIFPEARKRAPAPSMYIMCVRNDSNPESLDLRKIYPATVDPEGAKHGYIRVFDESGEGYLYPARYFIAVALPRRLPRKTREIFA